MVTVQRCFEEVVGKAWPGDMDTTKDWRGALTISAQPALLWAAVDRPSFQDARKTEKHGRGTD